MALRQDPHETIPEIDIDGAKRAQRDIDEGLIASQLGEYFESLFGISHGRVDAVPGLGTSPYR